MAFLFGCIEPDYNILSYLKGSLKIQLLKGHNFKNSEQHMRRMIEKLQQRSRWRMREYYCLGKLIHYVSDAFTYPHNENFVNGIKEHRHYEGRLNYCFKNYIALQQIQVENAYKSVIDAVGSLHRQYIIASAGIQNDVRYILETADTVFNMLIPEAAGVTEQPLKGIV